MLRAGGAAALALAVLGPAPAADAEGIGAKEAHVDPEPAPAQRRALGAIEDMRAEIARLAALRDAQIALLAWNRARAGTGMPPAALSPALCREAAIAAWCPLLRTTFGGTRIPGKGKR